MYFSLVHQTPHCLLWSNISMLIFFWLQGLTITSLTCVNKNYLFFALLQANTYLALPQALKRPFLPSLCKSWLLLQLIIREVQHSLHHSDSYEKWIIVELHDYIIFIICINFSISPVISSTIEDKSSISFYFSPKCKTE